MLKRFDVLTIAILIASLYLSSVIFLQIQFDASTWAAGYNLNALGDSLGGLTAPLALIFLIAAVIIQRQELMLTKAELAKSAEALASQVEEQRQHREFVGLQTELMRKEAEASAVTSRKSYKLSLFNRRYAIYAELDSIRQTAQRSGVHWFNLSEKISDLHNRSRFLFGGEVNTWFTRFQKEIAKAREISMKIEQMESGYWDNGGNWVPNTTEEMAEAVKQLNLATEFVLITLNHDTLYTVFAESMWVTD